MGKIERVCTAVIKECCLAIAVCVYASWGIWGSSSLWESEWLENTPGGTAFQYGLGTGVGPLVGSCFIYMTLNNPIPKDFSHLHILDRQVVERLGS